MNRLFFLLVQVIWSLVVNGQNYIVVDNQTHKPIPYCSIAIVTRETVIAADSEGRFRINLLNNDILIVSSTGYTIQSTTGARLRDTLFLSRKYQVMDSISVVAKAKPKALLGFPIRAIPESRFSPEEMNFECGQRFRFMDSSIYRLEKLYLPIEKRTNELSLVIHIYQLDSSDSIGTEVLAKLIKVNKLVNKRAIIDLSKENLCFYRAWGALVTMSWFGQGEDRLQWPRILVSKKSSDDLYFRRLDRNLEWDVFKKEKVKFGPACSLEVTRIEL